MSTRVLFVCTSNSVRSLMAEALLDRVDGFDAHSAGIHPAAKPNPLTIAALEGVGIDYAGAAPMYVGAFADNSWDYVISLSPEARDALPAFPGAKVLHWPIDDPTTEADFARVLADLSTRIDAFAKVARAAGKEAAMAITFVKDAPNMIEGLAIPFGGPIAGKDFDGESFDAATDLCLPWFGETGRPVLYGHGLNGAVKADLVGRQVSLDTRDDGHWAQVELDKSSRYRAMIGKLVDQGAMSFSSGAMPHLVQTTKAGLITRWPWVELSLTPTPANPLAVVYAVKSATDAIANLDIPDPLAAALKALDELASSRDEGVPAALSYADEGDRLLVTVKAFATRTQELAAMRAKEGRVLSGDNWSRLAALGDVMREQTSTLEGMLTATDPTAGKRLAAATLAEWEFILATLPNTERII